MDESWVLIESDELFGWVPSHKLSKEGMSRIQDMVPDRAPVGSGQTRGYVWTNQSTNLQETPQMHSKMLRLVAMGERLLALASTGDGVWIQVRDRRGDQGWVRARRIRDETGVLAGLPRTSRGVKVETVRLTEGSGGEVKTILVPMQQGVLIDAEACLGIDFPFLSLDSDGEDFFRRYDIKATAPTLRIKATTTSLKPWSLSFEYNYTYLAGLGADLAEKTAT
ncbi:MAG: SH3 domain-containing protein, partial [Myxococcota bacterium]|nr:SH3 domain-containing protein [Myxococcota bacterium]